MDPTGVITQVCDHLAVGDRDHAAASLNTYPFVKHERSVRKYSTAEALEVFIRDGFVDRYSGTRLVFPGTLRVVAHLLKKEFPYHSNWKMSETHPAFWQLTPTVDHVDPVCHSGLDTMENWVTTSMLRNSAKANWTLQELGWTLHPPGQISDWDGRLSWFSRYVAANPEILKQVPALRVWNRAAQELKAG
jgi:hypothetical protein